MTSYQCLLTYCSNIPCNIKSDPKEALGCLTIGNLTAERYADRLLSQHMVFLFSSVCVCYFILFF